MSLDASMLELMEETVTIEPFSAMTSNQAHSYGTAVSYRAQVMSFSTRIINAQGREVESTASVIIPGRVQVDHRSRVTLPVGFLPRQPPIQKVEPMAGLGLDHTRIWL